MKHKIFQVDGNNDSEGEDPEETNNDPLVLDDYGGITGPKLSQSSLPLILKDVRWQRFFSHFFFFFSPNRPTENYYYFFIYIYIFFWWYEKKKKK